MTRSIQRSTVLFANALALSVLTSVTAQAATIAQNCTAAQERTVAKYFSCRMSAEAKLATSGDSTRYATSVGKCEAKFDAVWPALEAKAAAAGSSCARTNAQARIRGQVDHQANVTATYMAGGATQVVRLENLDLHGRDFSRAELSGAILDASDLSSALLVGTNLTDAAMTAGTNFTGADLSSANLTGAVLSVIWLNTTCPDGTNSASNGSAPESCCANMNGNIPLACFP